MAVRGYLWGFDDGARDFSGDDPIALQRRRLLSKNMGHILVRLYGSICMSDLAVYRSR
jgi:hypothetical protein